MKLPSVRLKEVFTPSFTEDDIKKAAKEVMLSIEDVALWFEHLKLSIKIVSVALAKQLLLVRQSTSLTNRSKVTSKRHKKTCIFVVHVDICIRIRLRNMKHG